MDFYSVKNRPPREPLQLDYETSLLEVTNEISIKTQVERLLSAGERLHAYMNGDEYDYDAGEYDEDFIPDDDDIDPPYQLDTATDMLNEMEYQESKLITAQARAQKPKKQQSEPQQTGSVEAEEKTPQGEL